MKRIFLAFAACFSFHVNALELVPSHILFDMQAVSQEFVIYRPSLEEEPIPVKSFSRIFGSFEPSFRFILGGLYHTPYTTRPK